MPRLAVGRGTEDGVEGLRGLVDAVVCMVE